MRTQLARLERALLQESVVTARRSWRHHLQRASLTTGVFSLRVAVLTVALICGSLEVHAQAIQRSAFSRRAVEAVRVMETSPTQASRLAPPHRQLDELSPTATSGIRVRPIAIGVAIGALLGAGAGYVLAGTCDSQHCSSRDEVTTGALLGAGVGGLFGLLLGLPPRGRSE